MEQSVKLVAITKPVIEEAEDANEFISYCARVSNPSNQANMDTAEKLLKYCIRKKHWSVFEMADLVFEIKTTRDIGRQILRHRSFNFQEFSQRYANVAGEKDTWDIEEEKKDFFYREARLQDVKNRQNSIQLDRNDEKQNEIYWQWLRIQDDVLDEALSAYHWALDHGIAKEQARVVLPEGMTPTVMFMKGSLRSWVNWYMVRSREGETQLEHVHIARMIWPILIEEFPFLKEIVVET